MTDIIKNQDIDIRFCDAYDCAERAQQSLEGAIRIVIETEHEIGDAVAKRYNTLKKFDALGGADPFDDLAAAIRNTKDALNMIRQRQDIWRAIRMEPLQEKYRKL